MVTSTLDPSSYILSSVTNNVGLGAWAIFFKPRASVCELLFFCKIFLFYIIFTFVTLGHLSSSEIFNRVDFYLHV